EQGYFSDHTLGQAQDSRSHDRRDPRADWTEGSRVWSSGRSRAWLIFSESEGYPGCCEYDSRCWLERRPARMARAYSLDLRERVVAAVAAGESCRAVATKFKVSVASVVKWSQRFRANGSAAAYKVGGRRPYALASERDWLLARLAEKPDITLRALGA